MPAAFSFSTEWCFTFVQDNFKNNGSIKNAEQSGGHHAPFLAHENSGNYAWGDSRRLHFYDAEPRVSGGHRHYALAIPCRAGNAAQHEKVSPRGVLAGNYLYYYAGHGNFRFYRPVPAHRLLRRKCATGPLLLVTLFLWYRRYKTLEVYPIFEKPQEIFYWVAILFSNSLGTAFGDFLSDNMGFSYLQGAMITGAIIIVVVLLHYFTKINRILLFWIAFIFTRPFGATFGDFLTKPLAKGGLYLGTLNASLVALAVMAVLITVAQRQHKTSDAANT